MKEYNELLIGHAFSLHTTQCYCNGKQVTLNSPQQITNSNWRGRQDYVPIFVQPLLMLFFSTKNEINDVHNIIHYYILCPPKVFLGSTTFFYIIYGPQLLFQWDFTSTVMQFWNIQALPYQLQIIWFLPVIAMPTLEEKNSKVFLFSFS